MWRGRGGLVTGVDNDGGVCSAAGAAPPSPPTVMENDHMAVLGVALVVAGVAEPLLDLALCQIGEFHQPGDLCIRGKVVLQVAGFQLCQLLFGLLGSQTERVSAEGRVLLGDGRGEG